MPAFQAVSGMFASMHPAFGIIAMVLGLTFLITIHEAGHWFVARLLGFQTPVFSIGFGPRKWSIVLGRFWDTEFRLSPILAGGYVSLPEMQDETTAKELLKEQGVNLKELRFFPVWKRIAVALAGVTFNFIGAVAMLFFAFTFMGEPTQQIHSTSISALSTQVAVAKDAGLQPGDTFVSVDGKSVVSPDDLAKALGASKGKEVPIVVHRGSGNVTVNLTPDQDGHIGVALGVDAEQVFQRVSVVKAGADAGHYTVFALTQTVKGFGMMLHLVPRPPQISDSDMQVRGIVGIVQMGSAALGMGLFNFIWFLVMISVNLIVLNILPLPVLDGGHVVFFLWEKVSGKPVNAELKGRLYQIFGLLLIGLFVLGFYNDITHILTGK